LNHEGEAYYEIGSFDSGSLAWVVVRRVCGFLTEDLK
jgi:hypothetical protein